MPDKRGGHGAQVAIPRPLRLSNFDLESIQGLADRAREIASGVSDGSLADTTLRRGAKRVALAADRCCLLLRNGGSALELMEAGFVLGKQLEAITRDGAVVNLLKNKKVELKRSENLSQVKDKAAADTAQRMAKEKWADNVDQLLRTGQMAKIIVNELERSGFKRYALATVKGWIGKVAPQYAKKGGRSRKI